MNDINFFLPALWVVESVHSFSMMIMILQLYLSESASLNLRLTETGKKEKIEQLVNMSTEHDLVTLSDQFVNFDLAFDIKNIDKHFLLKNLKFIMFQFHTNRSLAE